jgi:hypothetical protein
MQMIRNGWKLRGGYLMLKYIKYYIPAITGILAIVFFLMGENYPTYFCISWSLFLIIGDYVLPRDKEIQQFSYPGIEFFNLHKSTNIILFDILDSINL